MILPISPGPFLYEINQMFFLHYFLFMPMLLHNSSCQSYAFRLIMGVNSTTLLSVLFFLLTAFFFVLLVHIHLNKTVAPNAFFGL